MNYHLCDQITWKESLLLLKTDMYAQRVYSSVWQMTKDVLYLSLTISAIGSLVIMIPALIHPLDTWWETILMVVSVPVSCMFPLIWVCAYFGWYRNLQKINAIMSKFTGSLDGVDLVTQYTPVSYVFRYNNRQFQAVFEETQTPGKPISVGQGKLLVALIFKDSQERSIVKLFEEIASYLKGKEVGDFAICDSALLYRFESNPMPSPQKVIDAMNLMLYLAQRFNLELASAEDVFKAILPQTEGNRQKAE